MASRCREYITSESMISEHLLEAWRGAGERRERGMRQCESRKNGGRATKHCLPGMTKPLETPAHSSCEWVPGIGFVNRQPQILQGHMRLPLSAAQLATGGS